MAVLDIQCSNPPDLNTDDIIADDTSFNSSIINFNDTLRYVKVHNVTFI